MKEPCFTIYKLKMEENKRTKVAALYKFWRREDKIRAFFHRGGVTWNCLVRKEEV